ncbi:MAG: carboxypeptidase regulatory-like domain-containing protein [Planctomycetaceae bacterium]|nr:carboxypeptidase regulatory-like domain-containing protein [Planctomycetaceae bacterium]
MKFQGLLVLGVLLAGCSGGGEGAAERLPTVAVSGKVTYQGNPVDGATVTFNPGKEPGKKAAFAVTNSEGEFTLTTYESGDGAIAGKYFVTVSKQQSLARPADPSNEENYVPPEELPPAPEPVSQIPLKYATPATSGIMVDVPSDSYDIVLTD